MRKRWQTALAFAASLMACAVFFMSGYTFVRQVGVQEDEVLFTKAHMAPVDTFYSINLVRGPVPAMILPYAGALKALVFHRIFAIWPADARSIRLPVLALGTASIFLFFVFLRMTFGTAAALITVAILALDPIFLLTNTFDWGIVAVQHFLLALGLVLLVLHHKTGRYRYVMLGSFVFGLAIWDKATFLWILAGLAVAFRVIYPNEARKYTDVRMAAIVALWAALGAAPLLIYNVSTAGGTLRWTPPSAPLSPLYRAMIMQGTLNGSALFGYLTRDEANLPERAPETGIERKGVWLSDLLGRPQQDLLLLACAASLILALAVRRTPYARGALFATVAILAGWLAMFPFSLGGRGAHHTILLWPLPELLVACAICEAASRAGGWRPAVALLLSLPLMASSAAVTNEYYASLVRWGAADYWSDAIYPLRSLLADKPATAIYPLDWGLVGPLRTLGRGKLPLQFTPWWLASDQSIAENLPQVRYVLGLPGTLFVRYADRSRHDNDQLERFQRTARVEGFEEQTVAEVRDRTGRKVYLLTQLVRRP